MEKTLFRPIDFYEKNNIRTFLGRKVERLDLDEHAIGFNMAGTPTEYPGGTAMNSLKYFGLDIVAAGMVNPLMIATRYSAKNMTISTARSY